MPVQTATRALREILAATDQTPIHNLAARVRQLAGDALAEIARQARMADALTGDQLDAAHRRLRHRARSGDPATSHAAERANRPRRASQNGRILAAMVHHAEERQRRPLEVNGGMTADELHAATQIPLNSVSTRVSEMKRLGWLTATSQARKTTSGVRAEVVTLTAVGHQMALDVVRHGT